MAEDVYYKKTINFNFWKHSLQFKTSQEIFSSHTIDAGTQFLLRTIVEAGYTDLTSVLDMGCGYGPLGLTLKALHPDSNVHLVDRDALAVEYTSQNVALNNFNNVEAFGSLGYDDVHQTNFKLMVSNIPGKAGEKVFSCLLNEAAYYLSPDGIVAIVVVTPLEQTIEKILKGNPDIEIMVRRTRPGHTVFHYRFTHPPASPHPAQSALEREIYDRGRMEAHLGKLVYYMRTAHGLPEFDSLDYRSEMLIKSLQDRKDPGISRAAIFNPGQGHAAVALWKLFQPAELVISDRDLLALRYTRLNLVVNGMSPESIHCRHQPGLDLSSAGRFDIIAGILREEEGPAAAAMSVKQAAEQLSTGGLIFTCASSTAITRLAASLESQKTLKVQERERWRANSLLVLEKT